MQVYANNIVFTLKIRFVYVKLLIISIFVMLFFFYLYKIFLFNFSVFLCKIMYILNIGKATKKMSINEVKDFIFENYYERIVIIQGNL